MVKYEDECVGCPSDMGCLGRSCRYARVPHYYCDECGEEIWYDDVRRGQYGEMLCDDCYNTLEEDDSEE